MILLISVIILILAALSALSIFLVRKSLIPDTVDYDENFKIEVERGSFEQEFYNSIEKEEFYTDSTYGYSIHGIWFSNNDSKQTVILVHGYRVNLFSSLRYLRLFFDKGYNVLIYDHRFHGKSGGENCSLGHFEKYDLKTMVDWVINKTGPMSIVGIHGESMGAATAILHAAIDERISFTIADCPYDDLSGQFAYRLKEDYRLPALPLMFFGSLFTRLLFKFSLRAVSPIRVIPHIKSPIMFIHGDDDTYVPPSNSVNMYHSLRGRKGLYLAKEAKHAESILTDREGYTKVVYRFIDSLKRVER